MYRLYPRLPLIIAESLAQHAASQDVEQLRAASSLMHPAMYFAPTGGSQTSEHDIQAVYETIRTCAVEHGYPAPIRVDAARAFDTQCGIRLFEQMPIHASEASHLEVWAFFTTVLVPDVVRWRFGGERTSIERFIGSDRGLRRNAFGRLWWRMYLLAQPQCDAPYHVFDWLVEDDLVQLTERNSIAAHALLIQEISGAFQQVSQHHAGISRRLLMRESIKRLRRLGSIVSFAALDGLTLQQVVAETFEKTAQSLLEF